MATEKKSWWRRAAAIVVRNVLALRYRVLDRRYGRLVLEEIDGVPLIILPQVFNPVLLRSGAYMARALVRRFGRNGTAGLSVLDLGTGCGVNAIFAARSGASVLAVDINPESVRCAQLNVLLNQLEDRIEVRQGDLFAPASGRKFDLVLFNPPFYRGVPRDNLEFAWRGVDAFERFARDLPAALTPRGQALLVLSSDGDGHQLLAELRAAGFRVETAGEEDLINEVLTLHAVIPPAGPRSDATGIP